MLGPVLVQSRQLPHFLRGLKRIRLPAKLLKASAWSAVGTVLAQSALLVGNLLAARLLGSEEYGAFGLTQSTATMVMTVASTGMVLIAGRGIAALSHYGSSAAASAYVRHCVVTAVAIAAAVGLALCVIAGWFASHVLRVPSAAPYLSAAAFLGVLLTNNQIRLAVLAGLQRFRDLAILRVKAGIFGALLLVAACFARQANVAIISAAIASGYSAWLAGRVFQRQLPAFAPPAEGYSQHAEKLPHGATTDWRQMIPAIASGMISTPVIWLCQAIASGGSGKLNTVAVITVISMWMQIIVLVPTNLGQALMPAMIAAQLNRDATQSPRSLFGNGLGLIAAAILPICLTLAFMAPTVLNFYGRDFAGHSGSFVLLVLATALQALSAPALVVVQVIGDFWVHFGSNVIWACLFVGYTVAFKEDGVLAFARASLIAFAVHTCLVNSWAVFRVRSRHGAINGSR